MILQFIYKYANYNVSQTREQQIYYSACNSYQAALADYNRARSNPDISPEDLKELENMADDYLALVRKYEIYQEASDNNVLEGLGENPMNDLLTDILF